MIFYEPHHWYRHLFDVRGSMLKDIAARVFICVLWSLGVVVFHFQVQAVDIPNTVHGLVGVAMGLLLVFRTNASYDRFWEGRKLWGGMVNETRNLARLSSALLDKHPDVLSQILSWTMAFPYASMFFLRGKHGLGTFEEHMAKADVQATTNAQHPPLFVAAQVTRLLEQQRRAGVLSDYQMLMVDQNVQLLVDYVGGCERIHRTPLPFAYVVHLRRALVLYTWTLPFALLSNFGWGTILGVLCTAYLFFGIEEIGVEIEDPFGTDDNDLPLEAISKTIETNLRPFLPAPPSGG
jgi:putative membrane protein